MFKFKDLSIGSKLAIPAQLASEGKNGKGLEIDYRGKKVLAVWRYLPALDWGIVVKIDASEALAPVGELGRLTMFLLVIAALVCFIAAQSVARSITDPIIALRKGAEIIGAGDLNFRIGLSSKDEIGQLSRAFDSMTEKLKESRDIVNKEISQREQAQKELVQVNLGLENTVKERTKDLQERVNELERFRKATIEREFRLKELRDEIERLKGEKKGA